MKKGFDFLQKYLMGPMTKIAQFKLVRAVMAAGMATIPFTIVGSMFLVFNILPTTFTGLQGFFDNTFFRFSDLYMVANTATLGILALYFNFVIGYELTKIEEEETGLNVNPLNGALLSTFAFFMTLPEFVFEDGSIKLLHLVTDSENVINGFRMGATINRLGTSGIFTAILMAVLVTQLYFLCVRKNWVVKMPDTVPQGVSRSFTALIPTFVIAFGVIIVNGTLILLGTDIYKIVEIPFSFITNMTNSWLGIMVIMFVIHALWIVGIHGANIIGALLTPIGLANLASNVNGAHLPLAGEFNNSFAIIGGSGATLLMTFYIAFAAKSDQLRILGKASAVPSIFNINEPIVFGMPIVYNPYLAIPFFLAPMVSASIAYFAIQWQIIKPIVAQVPWPSPVGLGAFVGSGGDWLSAVVAIICALVAFIIWYPFIKVYDAKLVKEEKSRAEEIAEAA